MLTDQTNLAFDLSPPLSPVEVGHRLLRALDMTGAKGNLLEIDLSDDGSVAK